MKKIRWDLIGILAAVAGVIMAVIAVLKSGSPKRIYIAVAMIIVFGGMGFFLNKFLWAPKNNIRRLINFGIPGRAKILEVHETNISVNNNPQYKILLEIKKDVGEIYVATTKIVVSRLKPNIFKTNKEVKVKIDPQNEKNVMIDES
ncbi:MAG: hypothetical protein M3139_05190 [Bacteroidota bacterium]|nr:hypothetical protein [Bacteroidota bacterium]